MSRRPPAPSRRGAGGRDGARRELRPLPARLTPQSRRSDDPDRPAERRSPRRAAAPAKGRTHRPATSRTTVTPAHGRQHRRNPVRPHGPATRPSRPAATTASPLARRAPRTIKVHRPRFKAGLSRRRLLAVFICTTMALGLVIARVALLQTSDADSLRAAGLAQRTSETTLRASRGVIFDRNGDELALSVPSTTVIANPKLVTDVIGTVNTLASLLPITPQKQQSLTAAFTAKDKGFVYVARQVDEGLADAVRALRLNGISTIDEDRRTMPGGEVGKSVIGLTDIDGKGIAGVELQYDDLLTGVDGEQVRQHDRDGRSLPGSGTVTFAPIPGDDLVLTIDRSVQYAVEMAMLEQVSTLAARGGTAVVMSSKTGEIIAMVGVRIGEDGIYRVTSGNIAAVDAAEPGSVAKAITVAAALNEGVVTTDTFFEVPWQKKFSDTVLHDAEIHATETWPVSKILIESSNIGTATIFTQLGTTLRDAKERQFRYMRKFGLGEKTPLDFPDESEGILKDWKKWEGIEPYTMSYGQGVSSTSIQLVSAINVLANDGVYIAPKLVKATIGVDGEVTDTPPSETREVVKPEVADQMNLLMREVVCSGTATRAQVPGVSVAGKTGTGLKAQPNGTYTDENGNRTYYSSFVGFFPAEDPEVTVLISIDEPPGAEGQVTRFGGTAAAPVFAKIAPTIMHEMAITPPVAGGGGCPEPQES